MRERPLAVFALGIAAWCWGYLSDLDTGVEAERVPVVVVIDCDVEMDVCAAVLSAAVVAAGDAEGD